MAPNVGTIGRKKSAGFNSIREKKFRYVTDHESSSWSVEAKIKIKFMDRFSMTQVLDLKSETATLFQSAKNILIGLKNATWLAAGANQTIPNQETIFYFY